MIHRYHFDPLAPMDPYICDPEPSTDPEGDAISGCLATLTAPFIILVVIAICSLFMSCGTTEHSSLLVEQHRINDMMQSIDSLVHQKTVVQQDSTWRQEILRQFQSIRERSDTSHHVVVDTAGNVIKETLVINNVREVTSETDRQELLVMSHKLEAMDSTMNIMRRQLSHSDSLLQSRQETTVKQVEKPLSWWQQARLWLGNLVLVALAVVAVWFILKKRSWWLRLLKPET